MEKCLILAWILVLNTAMEVVQCQDYYSQSVPFVPSPQKVTHLHFFLHDTMSGKNPSALVVARPGTFSDKLVPFGGVVAVDDPITVGHDITSEVIGNAQGLWVSSDQDGGSTLMVYMDFGFTKGEFNGSSIGMFSRNTVTETVREVVVVGGRGKFRMAEGFAWLKTYYVNFTTGDAIVEYNVTVIHY